MIRYKSIRVFEIYKCTNNIPVCRRCLRIDWTLQSIICITDELYQQINGIAFGAGFVFMRAKIGGECFHILRRILIQYIRNKLPPRLGPGFLAVGEQNGVSVIDTIIIFKSILARDGNVFGFFFLLSDAVAPSSDPLGCLDLSVALDGVTTLGGMDVSTMVCSTFVSTELRAGVGDSPRPTRRLGMRLRAGLEEDDDVDDMLTVSDNAFARRNKKYETIK